jgi:galactokinase
LRDVTLATFEAKAGQLDATTRRRARHVITEDDRTVRAVAAMRRGDIATLGRLMNESHVSLRDDYEVSSDALNAMVEAAQAHSACFGARMTGAGFGGCAVAIVRSGAADDFVAATSSAYQATTGNQPAVYVCSATDGAAVV